MHEVQDIMYSKQDVRCGTAQRQCSSRLLFIEHAAFELTEQLPVTCTNLSDCVLCA